MPGRAVIALMTWAGCPGSRTLLSPAKPEGEWKSDAYTKIPY